MFPWFKQCVTFNFFPSAAHELAYNLFNIFTIYVFPLIAIIICYSLIIAVMSRKSKESRGERGYNVAGWGTRENEGEIYMG